jgi:hypothetical protein
MDKKVHDMQQAQELLNDDVNGKLQEVMDRFHQAEELEQADVVQLRTAVKTLREEMGVLEVKSTKHGSAIDSAQSELGTRANQLQAKLDQTHVVIEEHRDEVHRLHKESTEKLHAMELRSLEMDGKHDLQVQALSQSITEGLTKELGNIQTTMRDLQKNSTTQVNDAYSKMADMSKQVAEDLTSLNKETEVQLKGLRKELHDDLTRLESETRADIKDLTKTITYHHEESIRSNKITEQGMKANREAVEDAKKDLGLYALTSAVDSMGADLHAEIKQESDKAVALGTELERIKVQLRRDEDELVNVEVEQVMEGMKNAIVAHSDYVDKKKSQAEVRTMLNEIRLLISEEKKERLARDKDNDSSAQVANNKSEEELRAIEASLAGEQVAQAERIAALEVTLKALTDMELEEELKELVSKEEVMILHHEEVQTDLKSLRKLCDDNVHDLADLRSLLQAGKFSNNQPRDDDSYFHESQEQEQGQGEGNKAKAEHEADKVGELVENDKEEKTDTTTETDTTTDNEDEHEAAATAEAEEPPAEEAETSASYAEESFLSDKAPTTDEEKEEVVPEVNTAAAAPREEEEEERPATVRLDMDQALAEAKQRQITITDEETDNHEDSTVCKAQMGGQHEWDYASLVCKHCLQPAPDGFQPDTVEERGLEPSAPAADASAFSDTTPRGDEDSKRPLQHEKWEAAAPLSLVESLVSDMKDYDMSNIGDEEELVPPGELDPGHPDDRAATVANAVADADGKGESQEYGDDADFEEF